MTAFSVPLLLAAITLQTASPVTLEPVSDTVLQYDDGTPHWVVWPASPRGVWFNTGDFYGSPCSVSVETVEVWFYHHAQYPWDTGTAYMEIWEGLPASPGVFVDSCSATAVHYAPTYFDFPLIPEVPPDFLCLQFTGSYSAGGWPSILTDEGEYTGPVHSYYSDSGLVPYEIGGLYANFMIRVHDTNTALSRVSWGELKSVFQ